MSHPIHIVTRFSGIGECETHAVTLVRMLSPFNPVTVWADVPTPGASKFGAIPISPFTGQMPRAGTLILLGTHIQPGLWLEHVKPQRLIVICVLSQPAQFFGALTALERPSLPKAELVFVSRRLRETIGLPGIICPEPVDLGRFQPTSRAIDAPFTTGRHSSRDIPEKHHWEDPSLYRMLAWSGVNIRLLDATCLNTALDNTPGIETLPAGGVPVEEFLGSLDCFFYRTSPQGAEPSGLVVMEALASGLPVIAHDSGGYTDWIEQGKNGYIFSRQEEAFDLLTTLKNQPEKRKKMAHAARASAEQQAGRERLDSYLRWLSA